MTPPDITAAISPGQPVLPALQIARKVSQVAVGSGAAERLLALVR
jgi:hypothetical protein